MKFRLFLVALFLCFPALSWAKDAQVKSVTGDAFATLPHHHQEKIVVGMDLPPGTTINTGNGTVGILLVSGAETVVTPNTDVSISKLEYSAPDPGHVSRDVNLNLTQGTIFNTLAHGDGVSSFKVQTPKGVAAARGTVWEVTVRGDVVTVKVVNGVVGFGGGFSIPGGFSFSTDTRVLVIATPQELGFIVRALVEAGCPVSGPGTGPPGGGPPPPGGGNGNGGNGQGGQGSGPPSEPPIPPGHMNPHMPPSSP